MEVLVKAGPVSIAVNSEYFDNYKKGVLSKSRCKGGLNSLDHQVPASCNRNTKLFLEFSIENAEMVENYP